MQTRDSIDDLAGLSELALDEARPSRHLGAQSDQDTPPRDSLVPRGTFTSAEPVPLGAGRAEPHEKDAEPQRPRETDADKESEPSAAAPREREDSAQIRVVPSVRRPPFLASEILHEDLMPAEPGRDSLTMTLRFFASLGLCVSAFSFGTAPFALISVGSLALLSFSFLRVPHVARALMVAGIAGTGLGITSAWRISRGGGVDDCLLAASTTLLASALLLRAWYRGSSSARGLVAAGLFSCLTWALMSADRKLLSLDWTLESWLPAVVWCAFVLLCVLSLLAFMDDETTGACDVWAYSLLCWYAVQGVTREILPQDRPFDESLSTINLAEPIFAGPLAVALAQLLARLLGQQRREQVMLRRRNA